ncbi:hypothetical protein [Parabacteroides sp. Marseille-P3160]|uniref:hypothetical protein n=1 Tax=Parabacteroides sp. Marseille-P3160 TaxID=1917887 RepID=UPI0009BAB804|nr:hypothetical protein [Parabacteroides sp. Marseille-P3160]
MRRRQTPKEKLLAEKERLRLECERFEKGFSKDLSYIQENMGSIAFSSIRSLIFPSARPQKEIGKGISQITTRREAETASGHTNYAGIISDLVPMAWNISKPFILTWSVRKAQSLIRNLLFSKKKVK